VRTKILWLCRAKKELLEYDVTYGNGLWKTHFAKAIGYKGVCAPPLIIDKIIIAKNFINK